MKRFKKLMALAFALVMCLSMMSISAFAAGTEGGAEGSKEEETTTYDYQQKLTVTGLEKDDTAHFYQIVTWVGDAEPAAGDVIVNGWKVLDAYKTVLTEDVFKAAFIGTPAEKDKDGNVTKEEVKPTGITSELAGKIAVAAKDQNAIEDVKVTGTDAVLDNTKTGRGAGLYMAIITPGDPDYVYNPVFVASNFKTGANSQAASTSLTYGDKSAVKKSKTDLDKKADTKPEDAWDDQNNGNKDFYWTTTAIGDTVDFTVTTWIPGYGNVYEKPFFKVTDKLTDLKLVAKSVKITEPTVPEGKATITEGTDNYSITFDSAWLKTIKEPTKVTITYKAIVDTTAPLNINREKNEVSTEFSNNPSDTSEHGFKKDTTQHYTFTLDAEGVGDGGKKTGKKTSEIVKVGRDAQGNPIKTTTQTSEITSEEKWEGPLAGAEFKLYTDADCTKEYMPKNADGTAGTKALVIDPTSADGRMTIAGLDAGKYWLQESKAPAGYVRDTSKIPIEIIANTEEVELTEYTKDGVTWISAEDYEKLDATAKEGYKSYTYKTNVLKDYTVKVNGETTATYKFKNSGNEAVIDWTEQPPVEKPFQIVNNQGTELPSTGGIGTTLFYIFGGVLVAVAGVLLVTRRRMNAR